MSESSFNFWLRIKSFLRYVLSLKTGNFDYRKLDDYKLVFEDDFKGSVLDLEKWRLGQPWGYFHPSFPYQYYGDNEEFAYVENNTLNLITKYKPKKFYSFKDSIHITISYGIGLIVSKADFGHGYYEIEAKMPKGVLLWPAIWLTAVKTWPPEIDILEAYSGKEGLYKNKKGLKNYEYQPNIHYGFVENNTKSSYGAISCPLPGNPQERFVKYAVLWEKDIMKFYYDGYLVFQTKRKEILEYFNAENVRMSIILNNAYHPSVDGTKYPDSVFQVKSVKYFAKN